MGVGCIWVNFLMKGFVEVSYVVSGVIIFNYIWKSD